MEVGTIIEGRYVVERTLASGGMATVHVVRHTGLDSLHALKILHIPSPEIRERLLLEGRLQARLRHPNIVSVTDTITIDGAPGLVMELVDGPALDEWLGENRPSLDEAESIFLGVLAAVDHAHRHGVVHRDLKPANVLLSPMPGGFLPKVADFGIAKVVEEVLAARAGRVRTRTGVAMGTPAYMAPEQIEGAGAVGPAADVFALGCILYDLVVGRPAFDGPHLIAILTASREGFFDDPAEVLPDLPQRVVDAIRGALAPELEDRIPDCTTLAQVLTGGRITTLSGAGARVAATPIEVPDGRYPRGLGSTGGRSKPTFGGDGGVDVLSRGTDVKSGSVGSASDAAASTSSDLFTVADDPSDDRPVLPPQTHPEVRVRRERRWRLHRLMLFGIVVLPIVLVLVVSGIVIAGGAVSAAAWWSQQAATVAVDEDAVPADSGVVGDARTQQDSGSVVTDDPTRDGVSGGAIVDGDTSAVDDGAPEGAGHSGEVDRGSTDAGTGRAASTARSGSGVPSGSAAGDAGFGGGSTSGRPSTGEDVAVVSSSGSRSSGDGDSLTSDGGSPPSGDADPVTSGGGPSSSAAGGASSRSSASGSAGDWSVQVVRRRVTPETQSGVFTHRAPAGMALLLVEVVVHNGTARSVEPAAPFELRVAGERYEVHQGCRLAVPGSLPLMPDLRAGRDVSGWLCFEIPQGARPRSLTFRAPGDAQPVTVAL